MTSFVFRNVLVWDSRRQEPEPGEVLVEDGQIKEVSDSRVQATSAIEVDGGGGVLMPGLIDCHIHVTLSDINLQKLAAIPVTLMSALAAKNMHETLMRGFTAIRDCGGADRGLAIASELGLFEGPRMFVSGRTLTQTGGHGDFRVAPESRGLPGAESCIGVQSRLADGVDEVRKAARDELRKGCDQVKVMVSGGVASPVDPIDNVQYSAEELRAAVAEARAWKTYVAAHSYTSESTVQAVNCGIRTIEHGNLIDLPTAELMAERGSYLVPTLATYDVMDKHGAELGLPPVSIEKLQRVKSAGIRAVEHCRTAGAKIGFGSDLLGDLREHQSLSFPLQAEAQSTHEVLSSATAVNAEILNQSGNLGIIESGAAADLIVVEGNPLEDLGLLQHQGKYIKAIMKAGKFAKNELD
ncbi:MAG: amidohydrolase family protein [Rhodobacteraceae bacterium]|nr:amidohydrolase family protein [Paracoccaceae bacterium]